MKIPALGDIFTLYRTLYRSEMDRAQRLESELNDTRNRLDLALDRATRAEEERSEAYKRFINFQARSQVFAVDGPVVTPPTLQPPPEAPLSRRATQLAEINKFMGDLRAHAGIPNEPAA